ncbi:MAG: PP2C family protein-serine/threonine phosphatase [Candidatus Gastranaerophilaceae bacterium]
MNYLAVAHTDIGLVKDKNQDSYCLMSAQTDIGEVLLAVICDGLGGLSKGELASKTVVEAFVEWFEQRLPIIIQNEFSMLKVAQSWNTLITKVNSDIFNYGVKNSCRIGTTVVATLFSNGQVLISNVGDSRCYSIRNSIRQLTKDHTYIDREIREGRMTKEAAAKNVNKNMLLQCVGATNSVKPDFFELDTEGDRVFLLCSDGFRHLLKEEEMLGILKPVLLNDETSMKVNLIDLTDLNKQRGEKDNITTILIKTIG